MYWNIKNKNCDQTRMGLKEYDHKDYLSFQKNGVGKSNKLHSDFMKIDRSVS